MGVGTSTKDGASRRYTAPNMATVQCAYGDYGKSFKGFFEAVFCFPVLKAAFDDDRLVVVKI